MVLINRFGTTDTGNVGKQHPATPEITQRHVSTASPLTAGGVLEERRLHLELTLLVCLSAQCRVSYMWDSAHFQAVAAKVCD